MVVNGEHSEWSLVTSGIPQGSVLGPLLFVIFINDLPNLLSSEVFLFADETKVFNKVKDAPDANTLQLDLDQLSDWSNKWLLRFNPDKCTHMHLGTKNITSTPYHLQGQNLKKIHDEKDIGVTIDEDL